MCFFGHEFTNFNLIIREFVANNFFFTILRFENLMFLSHSKNQDMI